MSTGEAVALLIVLVVLVLIVIGWLLYLAAGLVLVFTAFVIELPIIVSILMFILFPPTLIVFLAGLAMIHFGIAERYTGDVIDNGRSANRMSRAARREAEKRRSFGYDD